MINENQQNLFPEFEGEVSSLDETIMNDDYPSSYLPASSEVSHVKSIVIKNFKAFENCEIIFNSYSILTGINNSGKSTVLQALWVAFECLRLCVDRNNWRIPDSGKFRMELDVLPINDTRDMWFARKFKTQKGYKPISLRVVLTNGFFFEVAINYYFGALNIKINDWNKDFDSKTIQNTLQLTPMFIPGYVELLAHEEIRNTAQIHKRAMSGYLSSITRNVLYQMSESETTKADSFNFVAKAIKKHFDVDLQKVEFDPDKDLELRAPYAEKSWILDISSAGSGMYQVLKIASFIVWRNAKIVLLDEPDAHLHSSMQLRLSSFLQELSGKINLQFILATHSCDLIANAPVESIIPIDNNANKMQPIDNIDHLLLEYKKLGNLSNANIALLYKTKRCLFVEGNSDSTWLPLIGSSLGLNHFIGPKQYVIFEFKGSGKFSMIKDLVSLFERVIGSQIEWYVIRDRDYSTDRMVNWLHEQAKEKGIERYHIWERYSLENYFLEPNLLKLTIDDIAEQKKKTKLTDEDIDILLNEATNLILQDKASIINYIQKQYKYYYIDNNESEQKYNDVLTLKEALEYVENKRTLDEKLKYLSGKKIFGKFINILQTKFNIHIRVEDIITHMDENNTAEEIKKLFDELE